MELKEEKKVEMVEFEVDMPDEEFERLYNLGLQWIREDKNTIVNYAVNRILEKTIEQDEVERILKINKEKQGRKHLKTEVDHHKLINKIKRIENGEYGKENNDKS